MRPYNEQNLNLNFMMFSLLRKGTDPFKKFFSVFILFFLLLLFLFFGGGGGGGINSNKSLSIFFKFTKKPDDKSY